MSDLINSTCRCKILFADLIVVIHAIDVDEVDVEIDVDIVFMLLCYYSVGDEVHV